MTQIALLRGINVGKAKRVAMADLREIVESLGFSDVQTLLNSGNVVFASAKKVTGDPAARIEKALTARTGITARVTVLGAAELATIVDDNPLLRVAKDPSRMLVTVLTQPADRAKLAPLVKEKWAPEALALGKRVAYLWCPKGVLESRAAAAVQRALGDAMTSRNWATILKLHAMASGGA
jgi:uncharacterized protein (DUF1697 family)